MPHKSARCPKCHGRTKQVEFLEASPNISNSEVLRGKAKFYCKWCNFTFTDLNSGIKRIGASRTYRHYHPKKGDEKDD
jgi:protein-arginine kinase activator protein McsA